MISRGGAGGYSLVAFHTSHISIKNHPQIISQRCKIKKDIDEGGDHVLGGRMCSAGHLRSLLSSDGADRLGGTTVWIHWNWIDQSMFSIHQYFH